MFEIIGSFDGRPIKLRWADGEIETDSIALEAALRDRDSDPDLTYSTAGTMSFRGPGLLADELGAYALLSAMVKDIEITAGGIDIPELPPGAIA